MDREQEEDLGALGLAGIYCETFRVLRARRLLFTRMAALLVLPLSALLLVHVAVLRALFSGSDVASDGAGSDSVRLAALWAAFFLLEAAYLFAILALSLASTAFCVFSVASRYCDVDRDGDDPRSAARVIRTVPTVWATLLMVIFQDVRCVARVIRTGSRVWSARLVATFRGAFLLLLEYSSVFGAAALLAAPDQKSSVLLRVALLLLGGAAYLAGVVYISAVCHLACVVSVLEDAESFGAMHRSDALLAGKFWTAAAIFAKLDGCFVAMQLAFGALVVDDRMGLGIWFRVAAGLAMAAALCAVVVVGLVAQVVVYFVCKSYHHESFDAAANLARVGRRGRATRRRQ